MDRTLVDRTLKVILGVTGSISAYKTPWLVRDLRRAGADVRVVMTPSATQFVAPLALEATSQHPVVVDPYATEIQDGGSWHVHLARWADVMLIAPCSATTLARLATGLCDTALMTVATSLPQDTPLIVAPAMDSDMWVHASVGRNLARIREDGVHVLMPESGELASGLIGQGRLPELQLLVDTVLHHGIGGGTAAGTAEDAGTASSTGRDTTRRLAGRRVVVSAGPTHEYIDDVRFLGNASSGTMGFAVAEAARDAGALVTLVAGPVTLPTPTGVERVNVTSAQEMFDAVFAQEADVYIMAAAVADYRPAHRTQGKIKKTDVGDLMNIPLQRTPDILAALGEQRRGQALVVGFALESHNVVAYATEKLHRKDVHMIVANQAGGERSGFGVQDNTITIITRNSEPVAYPPMSKHACAVVIVDAIGRMMQ